MKRILLIVLVLVFLTTSFAGCSRLNDNTSSDKISVVTTIFPPYDFTRQIAGEHVELMMLLPPGSESHSYEPTPQDIITIQNCDVFVYGGGESDAWVEEVLESMDTGKMEIITLMDCVETVEEEIVEGMEDDHDHDHDHEDDHDRDTDHEDDHGHEDDYEGEGSRELDEHVWTSPKNAGLIVQKISDTLSAIDSENASVYAQNTAAYLEQINELDVLFREIADNSVRRTLVFGDRFPFRYLADAYDLEYFAAFPGCSTETEASASTVAFLIDKIKAEDIPVVFHVELSNQRMANVISESTGAKVLLLHACHNVSKAEFESGATYLELMNRNAENLQEALK